MTKSDAKRIAEKNGIKLGKWNLASRNTGQDVWWINIPVADAAEQRIILLHDTRKGAEYLHVLDVPAGFISDNADKFKRMTSLKKDKGLTSLKKDVYNIELSCNKRNMFQDVKSGGGNIQFRRFVRKEGIQ